MSAQAQNIINQVNEWIGNYAYDAFINKRLNSILQQITLLADAASGGTANTNVPPVPVVSANFSNATDCPLVALNGLNLQVYYNELGRYIYKADGEWSDLAGGGFRVNIPGFDSTQANYHFMVFVVN